MNREELIREINLANKKAYIDKSINSNLAYKPQFVSNDYKKGKKVLNNLEYELSNCDEFIISVAFITNGAVTQLKQTLLELEAKGIKGKILTTDYKIFTEPKALDFLSKFSNIEVKMYLDNKVEGFHTKGYIFYTSDTVKTIIGSSNLTMSALTKNKEWNTKLVSTKDGEVINDILEEFENLWQEAKPLNDVIDTYIQMYEENKRIQKDSKVTSIKQHTLMPNSMQVEFVNNLKKIIEDGEKRALLISATGTGKTYASAFALRHLKPRKALFLVHREQIAKQAIDSYKCVFGDTITFGLLSGNSKEYEADYLFSTMQMMAREEIRNKFNKDEFDIIVIDEVHRSGSKSYENIIKYFTPKFYLGMTASPDRTDDFDIYGLFDHNIAYEIRLEQALMQDLLCPFHYFGISDVEFESEDFRTLISKNRVEHIIKKAEYYGFSGERVKGLIFCSRQDEVISLSKEFNLRGYKTKYLTGSDSQNKREEYVERLTSDYIENERKIDYILTVDIFNEGVDLPEINQIIMLRPTQSPIVFIQQLGRGLRKSKDKEFVVIIDFIANYDKNFLIPIALSGDRSFNKDSIRRYVAEGNRVIPGCSTIHFDEISRKRIYDSIDKARLSDIRLLKDSYYELKNKLGRIPSLLEFSQYGSVEVTKFFSKCGSYYSFLRRYEKDYQIQLSQVEEEIVEYMSKKLTTYKRIDELLVFNEIFTRFDLDIKHNNNIFAYAEKLYSNEKIDVIKESVIRNLSNEFPSESEKVKYTNCVFLESSKDNEIVVNKRFYERLKNPIFYKMARELVDFGIAHYKNNYSKNYKETNFVLYQKYTYEDVCRLLNWERNLNAQNIGGYFYDTKTKTLPVFINYHKSEDAIAYEDRFVSENEIIALSKHPRNITSVDATHIYKKGPDDKDNKIYLFVRKNKDDKEAKEFYFLGEVFAVGEPKPIYMEKTKDNAFEIVYRLDEAVRGDIYDYIVNG